jgi:hypothetical protein
LLEHQKSVNIARLNNQLKLVKTVGFNFVLWLFLGFMLAGSHLSFAQINPGSRIPGFGNSSTTPATPVKIKPKQATVKKDTVISIIPDSLKSADSQLETTVIYKAKDSTILDVESETLYLYGEAVVTYGDIELKADFIKLNWGKSEVYAHGLPDTTKKSGDPVRGKPIFSQSGDDYNSDTIKYNFKSKKAIIKSIVTQQGEGFVQGKTVKKDPKDNLYLVNAMYTTCNLKEPHFHINAKKIKMVNKKSLISGPFNFVLSDIPLPIGLPFGFFPIPKKKEIGTSGFIMGNYGEEPNNRGFYFRDFGYYHAFNENIGAKVLAQVYSKGSWGLGIQSNYLKRYKYSGNLNLQFNYNRSGAEINRASATKDFNIGWSHSPQSRRPDRSFSASVNLVSNGFNQNNRRLDEVDQYTNNAFGSSVQYTRTIGKLLRTSTGFRADQNVTSKIFNASTDYSIGLNQFNPFIKEKNMTGGWWDAFRVGLDISGGYKVTNTLTKRSTSYTDYNIVGQDNNPVTDAEKREQQRLEQLLRTTTNEEERAVIQAELKKLLNPVETDFSKIMQNGIFNTSYSVPIALPNIKIARYINITPSISYRGDFFTKQLKYTFADQNTTFQDSKGRTVDIQTDANTEGVTYAYDAQGNVKVLMNPKSGGVVHVDTISKPAFGQNVSFATGMNTRAYGTYRFNKNGRLQAIRHTIAPSISVSYTPNMASQYSQRTKVRTGASERYLPKFLNGGGSASAQSANLSFGLSNQLEAKMRSRSDTAEKEFEKISLLNNFDISGSYNLLADKELNEFALSNINLNANTNLFKDLITFNFGTTFDPYAYVADTAVSSNLAGLRITEFKWNKNKYSGTGGSYLSGMNISISTRLTPQTFSKDKAPPKTAAGAADPAKEAMAKFVAANPMAYVDFSIPWSVNFSYSFDYRKQGLSKAQITQTFQVQGDLSLTPKWKVNFTSGWDFVYKSVTLTTFSILRELHCWDMSFNWTPIAGNNLRSSTYSFTFQPRSSLLRDLKISRRRTYYDKGGF